MNALCPLFAMLVLAPQFVSADEPEAVYRDLVTRAKNGDLTIDFHALRFACLKVKKCDARGDNKEFVTLRQAMQAKDFEKAAKITDKLIDQGFVNIQAHAAAAQIHTALNQPEKAAFHREVASALIRSIVGKNDGKTKETAFEVIGTFEEYIVVNALGLPFPTSQSLLSGKPHSYDKMTIKDPKTGETVELYFNIDAFFPMKL
jgi:uncharacterized protein DUF4919